MFSTLIPNLDTFETKCEKCLYEIMSEWRKLQVEYYFVVE